MCSTSKILEAMANTISVKLRLATDGFIKSMNRAERQLRRSGERMARMGNELSTSLSVPILGVGAAALKSFADMEKFSNGLASMMGSTEAAAAEMERLKEVAQAPGLDLTQAVKGSVRLQSVGIEAGKARDVLAQAGNAIALVGGSSDDLDGVTLALQQIGSKGKVFAEEINQINERLPQIRAAMKAAFGTANTEDIQAMGISAEQFIAGITEELGKLPRATGGMANSFNNARQAVVQALSDIGASLEENFNVSGRIDAFSERIQNLATAFTNLSPRAQKSIVVIGGMLAVIGPLMKAVGALKLVMAAAAANVKILTSGMLLATNAINLFSISNLKATAAILKKNVAMMAENLLVKTAIVLVDGYILAQTALVGVKKLLTGQIKIMTVAQKALNFVLSANPIGLVVLALAALGTAFVAAYQNVDWFRKGVDQALDFINRNFTGMVKGVRTAFKNFPALFKATLATLKVFVSNAVLNFKKLSLSAKEFRLKFAKALTIGKDKKAALTKSINAIGDQKELLKEQGQKLGEVFRTTFEDEVEKIKYKNITGPSILSSPAPLAAPAAGGGGTPSLGSSSVTKSIESQTQAVEAQAMAVERLQAATSLQGVAMAESIEPAAVLGNTLKAIELPTEKFTMFKEELGVFNEQLTSIVTDGLANFASAIGELGGKLAAGNIGLKEFAGGVLSTIVGVLSSLGELAIKTGVGILGINLALKSLNPAAAIAAGVALKAFAGFIGGKVSDLATPMAKGGIVLPRPGGTIAQIGEAGKAEAVIPLDRLDQMMGNRGGGGGYGRPVVRITGRELLFLIEDEQKRQGRSF